LNRTPARSVFRPRFPDSKENVTERSLTRRAFPKEITNNQEAAEYVIEKVTGSDPPDGFFAEGTPAAVGYLRKFEDEAFSFGTAGLHGCTMIAIISNRAVYIVSHCIQNLKTRAKSHRHISGKRILPTRKTMILEVKDSNFLRESSTQLEVFRFPDHSTLQRPSIN
jgi:hypothetical protein